MSSVRCALGFGASSFCSWPFAGVSPTITSASKRGGRRTCISGKRTNRLPIYAWYRERISRRPEKILQSINQETGGKINVLPLAFTPAEGQIFNLLDWGALSGNTFSSNLGPTHRDGSGDTGFDLDLPDISGSGLSWDISLFTSHGIIVVTPEPTRALLLLFGLAPLLFRRRRLAA
ncbi:MAG TPA: hypothetical protein VD994_07280 [Prosthecobacter sp.]|nr:hypothetical protein [Prosthecobacter sp.]